jgi:hypothetical protein
VKVTLSANKFTSRSVKEEEKTQEKELQTHKPIDSLTLNKKVMRYCKQDDQNKGQ